MKQKTIEFLELIEDVELEDMIFLDESGINIHMAREYGYSPKGERLYDSKPGQFTKNYTVIGTLTKDGIGPMMTVNGGTTKEVFFAYLEQVLLPTVRVGQVLILDNLSAHKSTVIRELCAEAGIELIYTPPYSPEWNPIEMAWSKIKTFLRAYAARGLEALENALVQAANLVTSQDALGWIGACTLL